MVEPEIEARSSLYQLDQGVKPVQGWQDSTEEQGLHAPGFFSVPGSPLGMGDLLDSGVPSIMQDTCHFPPTECTLAEFSCYTCICTGGDTSDLMLHSDKLTNLTEISKSFPEQGVSTNGEGLTLFLASFKKKNESKTAGCGVYITLVCRGREGNSSVY